MAAGPAWRRDHSPLRPKPYTKNPPVCCGPTPKSSDGTTSRNRRSPHSTAPVPVGCSLHMLANLRAAAIPCVSTRHTRWHLSAQERRSPSPLLSLPTRVIWLPVRTSHSPTYALRHSTCGRSCRKYSVRELLLVRTGLLPTGLLPSGKPGNCRVLFSSSFRGAWWVRAFSPQAALKPTSDTLSGASSPVPLVGDCKLPINAGKSSCTLGVELLRIGFFFLGTPAAAQSVVS